ALPHDWLTWRLRGYGPANPALGELVTDRSDASGTAYFDPARNEYDRDLLAHALRIDRAAADAIVLPRVLPPAGRAPAGRVAASPRIETPPPTDQAPAGRVAATPRIETTATPHDSEHEL